jgi:hypothetical protein
MSVLKLCGVVSVKAQRLSKKAGAESRIGQPGVSKAENEIAVAGGRAANGAKEQLRDECIGRLEVSGCAIDFGDVPMICGAKSI